MHFRQTNIAADAGVPLNRRFSIGGSRTISGPQNDSEMIWDYDDSHNSILNTLIAYQNYFKCI
jgi:hypothetical protein